MTTMKDIASSLHGRNTAPEEETKGSPVFRLRDIHEARLYNFAVAMQSCVVLKKVYLAPEKDVLSIIQKRCFMSDSDSGFFFFASGKGYAEFGFGKTVEIKFSGETQADIEEELKYFSALREVDSYVNWVYSKHGDSVSVPVADDSIPADCFYPFLGESLVSYYDRFMESDQSILVLYGPPGTGKSSFIKGLLQHTRKNATVTFDKEIVSSDGVFAEFVYGDSTFFVLEDADNLLLPRKDGNDLMAKFLNVGEGLVKVPGKKLIFTTNLPNISDIDPALIRPGRCFDVVQFRALDSREADKVREYFGQEEVGPGGVLTEICNGNRNVAKKTFGFV